MVGSDEALASLAFERVRAARENRLEDFAGRLDVDAQVYTFWLSLIALREAGSVKLLEEVVEREVELAGRHLASEDDGIVVRIAESLGLRVSRAEARVAVYAGKSGDVQYKVFGYRVPVRDYIRVSARSRVGELKLVNSPVKGGQVYLDGETLRLLVREAFRVRLREKLRELEAPESGAFGELVEKLRALESAVVSGLDELSLPPCLREIAERRRSGESLRDEEVHTLLSYLKAVGAPREHVARLLRELKLADETVAETIAAALEEAELAGPLRCEELRKRGVCFCEEELTQWRREDRSGPLERPGGRAERARL